MILEPPPFLSVIVPLFDRAESVEQCLISLRESTCTDYEILVADDGSPDGDAVAAAAAQYGARVIRIPENRGPAVARNAAARAARGDVLVFVDADVTVHPDALDRIACAFHADPSLDALMGSYDLNPKVTGTVAVFRNLLHAHVHHRSPGSATTFWAGCGGVRRLRFEQLGGFSETYRQPSIEDVEFGMRLYEAGGRIALDPAIQVTHHKRWTLFSMLGTDIFRRAMPWTEIVFRHGWPRNLNFRWRDRLSVIAAMLLPALAVLAIRFGSGWSAAAAAVAALLAWMQLALFRFLARARGAVFAALCFPLYVAHLLAAAVGFGVGLCRWQLSRDRWLAWVAALLAALIFFGVQLGGGAYAAEFDGYPDEAAHFMTGLMLRDLMVQWPLAHPVTWVEQYYLHYPKVAFLHWPPLFHAVEAVWWLFLAPSRATGMLLIGFIGLAAALAFYRLARGLAHPALAAAAACVLIAAPVFQESVSQIMAELPILLCELLLLGALARFLKDRQSGATQAALWCALALLVKGTGVCLVPALLAVCARRRRQHRGFVVAAAFAAAGIGFVLWAGAAGHPARWGGVNFSMPWAIPVAWKLAGPGFALLAVAGMLSLIRKREPVALAAAAVAASTLAVSFFLRAMNEPRHWILLLPCLLLLSLAALRAPRGIPVPALAAALALAFFPWTRYQQQPAGYNQLAASIRQPARMLVSAADGWEEGSWVVLASLREPRPSSVIVRASKVLARSGWSGAHYRVVAATPAQAGNTLDRLGIDTVILDNRSAGAPLEHHAVLRRMLAGSSAWRQCAAARELSAWCRTQPSIVPRQPLTLDLQWTAGRTISEQ